MASGIKEHCSRKLQVLDNPEKLAASAVEKWMELASLARERGERFTVALSGGKTPVPFYKMLTQREYSHFRELTYPFMVDERYIPKAHQDSNYRMLFETLFSHLNIPEEHIHPICTDFQDMEEAADAYESRLRDFFSLKGGDFPRFSLILLGIGEDGHTASLFPGNSSLREKKRLVIYTSDSLTQYNRLTLTIPVLNNAQHVLFLVSGKNKASVLREIIEEKECILPAALIRPRHGELLFLVERDAASKLTTHNKNGRERN